MSPSRVSPEGAGCAASFPSQESEEAQMFLSKSFSRTVQDWEEARRRHSETKDKTTTTAARKKDDRSASTERDKKTEKELRKIEKKEQKLEHELTKLAQLRLKLDSQEEAVKAEDWGGRQRRRSGPMHPSPPLRVPRCSGSSGRRSRAADSGGGPWDTLSTAQQSSVGGGGWEERGGVAGKGGGGGRRSISVSQTSLDSLSSADSEAGQGEDDVGCQRQEQSTGSHQLCQRTQSSPGASLKDRDRRNDLTFSVR